MSVAFNSTPEDKYVICANNCRSFDDLEISKRNKSKLINDLEEYNRKLHEYTLLDDNEIKQKFTDLQKELYFVDFHKMKIEYAADVMICLMYKSSMLYIWAHTCEISNTKLIHKIWHYVYYSMRSVAMYKKHGILFLINHNLFGAQVNAIGLFES